MNALEPFSAADTVAHGRGPENAPEAVLSRSSGIGGALASHNVSENLEDGVNPTVVSPAAISITAGR
ncbi:MAG: hypothetical protein ACOYBT_10225, partial [Polynucleobacter sp.]